MTPAEPATTPLLVPAPSRPVPSRRPEVAAGVALLALVAVLAEAAADVLPDGPVVGVVTPVRLALGIGLVALLLGGPARTRPGLDGSGAAGRPLLRHGRTGPLDPAAIALGVAVASLLATAALATLTSGTDWSAWRGILTGAATFVLAAGVVRARPAVGPALGLLSLGAVGTAAAIAVRQFAAGTPTGFCRGALDGSDDVCGPGAIVRVVGTFANPNLLAAFLVLLLPLAAAGSFALADRPSRLVGTTVVVTGYAAVVLTGSRGGVAAAAAGAVVFALLRRPTRRRALLLAAGATAAGLVVLLVVTGGRLGLRADIWRAALHLVLTHPLGVGPGRAGALLDAAIPGPEAFQHAHDLWLNWAVECGWPGLAAASAVTVAAGAVVLRRARTRSASVAALGAGLGGFAVLSLTDDPANALRIALALGIVLGMTAGPAPVRDHADPTHRHRRGQRAAGAVRSRSGSR